MLPSAEPSVSLAWSQILWVRMPDLRCCDGRPSRLRNLLTLEADVACVFWWWWWWWWGLGKVVVAVS